VAPSFRACNLTRSYELETRVGLGYGAPGNIQVCQVSSHWLEVIYILTWDETAANSLGHPLFPSRDSFGHLTPLSPPRRHGCPPHSSYRPYSPRASNARPHYPPQLGTAGADEVADAPPSYEDAITDEIAPVESVGRHYSGVTDANAPELDETGSARLGDLMGECAPPPFDEADPAEGESARESRE
jgi:hypothetical protein